MAVLDFSKVNKKNTKNRGDYGVRVARPGFDAGYCAQNQLLFNSNWPILQICKVVDLGDVGILDEDTGMIGPVDGVEHKYYDQTNDEWIDELPAGMNRTGYVYMRDISIGRQYLYYSVDAKGYTNNDYTRRVWEFRYKKIRHGLGYVPFFFMSEEVSAVQNHVVLTSIDISKDVDYPYTEAALPMLNPTTDYGIKSASAFGKRVPGLSSNMFSKLVQCVKKTSSSQWEINIDGVHTEKVLCWSPFSKAADAKAGVISNFEAFSFSAYNCPFLTSDLATTWYFTKGDAIDNKMFDDGPYYSRDIVVRLLALAETSFYSDAMAYTNLYQAVRLYDDASLVILRSPMVSPEYEEVII
jgi:hypothetical protein